MVNSGDLTIADILGTPGLVPVSLNPAGPGLRWMDLGGYHCYQGFFEDGIRDYLRLNPNPQRGVSDLGLLAGLLPMQTVAPTGFLFHAGRCGSTLLARILARSRRNIVIGEASAQNGFWRAVAGRGDAELGLFRDMVLAMGRQRLPSYDAHLIKFTSYNILRYGWIRKVFPEVPAVFLFREPGAMLASLLDGPPQWLGNDCGDGFQWQDPADAVRDFFSAALAVPGTELRMLDYHDLTPESLPVILEWLGQRPAPLELRQMLSEFSWYSKSATPERFHPRQPRSGVAVSRDLTDLYRELRRRARSDWPDMGRD